MKYIIGVFFLFASLQLVAQNCNDNTHSTNINDSWISCSTSPNPNSARGNSHWVMYDFGRVYGLTTTHIWNYNVTGQTNRGMRNIIIDYSADGTTWTQATTFTIPQASGNANYTGVTGPNINGISARYIIITATSTWGHSCAGISEVKFNVVPVNCFTSLTHPTLPTLETGIADYESSNHIISNATIQAGARVDYDGTDYVLMSSGFVVQRGSVFNAFIDGCNNGAGGVNINENDSKK